MVYISGVGVGVTSVVPPVLLNEIADEASKGIITTLHQVCCLPPYKHFSRNIQTAHDYTGHFHCIHCRVRVCHLCKSRLAVYSGLIPFDDHICIFTEHSIGWI